MTGQKQITKILEELKLLGEVSLAFSQISSSRMKKVRGLVLSSRDFQFSIHDIFEEVLASYAREVSKYKNLKKDAKGNHVTFLSHNGKTVALFISANTGLYGDIVNRTFELFKNDIKGQDVEVAIIGKLGLSMFQEAFPGRPHTYFDLSDSDRDNGNLRKIIDHIVQYDRVQIYYGKYENVVRQVPSKYDISAEVPIEGEVEKEVTKYIFEPSLTDLLSFFETELFTSLFDHSVYESQLAKYASRMISMDSASQKIEQKIKETTLDSLRSLHASTNRKQQNALTSVYFLEVQGV